MSLTVVVSARSNGVVMRPDIWSGGRPVYCQTTPITGMRISGKMSVGVRIAARGPMIRMSNASTTNVYGRLRAILTMAFIGGLLDQSPNGGCIAIITVSRIARVGFAITKISSKAKQHYVSVILRQPKGPAALKFPGIGRLG